MTSRRGDSTVHARTVSRATLVFRELRRATRTLVWASPPAGPFSPAAPTPRLFACSLRDGDSRLFAPPVNDLPRFLELALRCCRKLFESNGLWIVTETVGRPGKCAFAPRAGVGALQVWSARAALGLSLRSAEAPPATCSKSKLAASPCLARTRSQPQPDGVVERERGELDQG